MRWIECDACVTRRLSLRNDEVHVWRAALDLEPARAQRLEPLLSQDERVRAGQLCFRRDGERFVVARAFLRILLGLYLQMEPDQVPLRYSPLGKPGVATGDGRDRLRFSLSHSHGMALYAMGRGRELGIDLECVRPHLADEAVAERFFSPREVTTLRALPPAKQPEAFFACWTRKEAYLKARGEGLSLPRDAFDVSLAPGEPVALLRTASDPNEAARWSLQELFPGRGYVAALAVEGHGWQLKCWHWPAKGNARKRDVRW